MKRKNYFLTLCFLLTFGVISSFGQTKPFPQNVDYPFGTQPTGYHTANSASLDWADANSIYNKWLSTCYTEIRQTDRARIEWDGGGWTGSSRTDKNYTASEGIGYSLVITAYYGDKVKFDKLLNFYNFAIDQKAIREGKSRTELLMPWLVDKDGIPYEPLGGNGPATDGDIDAAYGLIVAEEQWPGNGYIDRAREILLIIKNQYFEVCNGRYTMAPGNFGGCSKQGEDANDVSYYSPAYFKVFADVMYDADWDIIAQDSYYHLWAAYHANLGNSAYDFSNVFLAPDFQEIDGSPHVWRNNNFAYDASRVPWRMVLNYLWNGDPDEGYDWLIQAENWAYNQGVNNIKAGYSIDGTNPEGYSALTFTAGFAVGAMVLDETKVTDFATEMVNMFNSNTQNTYFNLSVATLYSLTLTGNYWKPAVNYPIQADDIISIAAPANVSLGESVDVVVNYSSTTNRDIVVSFQQNTSPFTEYASQTVSVSQGIGSETITLVIPSNTPLGTDAYKFQTYITETGMGWNERLDSQEVTNVSCNEFPTYPDDLISVNGPQTVSPGEQVTVSIDYSASTDKDIVTEFQLNSDPYTTFVVAVTTVSAGTGTINNVFTIPTNQAPGNGYQIQTYLTEVNGDWLLKSDNIGINPVEVLDPNGPQPGTISRVESIVKTVTSAGGGNKKAVATVTITDENGSPIQGATVSGTFSGDFNESNSATTNSSGVANVESASAKKGTIVFEFCVDNVSAALPYDPNSNVVTCTGSGSRIGSSSPTSSATLNVDLDIYPNPNTNGVFSLFVSGADQEELKVSIYNIQGRFVAERTICTNTEENFQLDLTKGLYVMKITNGQESKVERLIVK